MFISKFLSMAASLTSCMPHYLLRLKVSDEMRELYQPAVLSHNKKMNEQCYFDAGFDLICPTDVEVTGLTTAKINLGVSGSMTYVPTTSKRSELVMDHLVGEGSYIEESSSPNVSMPVGYFLYPRSSTGTKTPLRLANSIGVIDSGYRGNYIAVFDNVRPGTFNVEKGQRLVQICAPNIMYPIKVELVDDLGEDTLRGAGGFGSTGK